MSCALVDLPHGDVVGFKDVTSRLGAEALAQLSVLKEAAVKEAVAAFFGISLVVCSVDVSSLSMAQEGLLCEHSFCVKTTPILAQSVFVLRGHRLYRDIVVLFSASIAFLEIWVLSLKLLTEDQKDLKYRSIPHEGEGESWRKMRW